MHTASKSVLSPMSVMDGKNTLSVGIKQLDWLYTEAVLPIGEQIV